MVHRFLFLLLLLPSTMIWVPEKSNFITKIDFGIGRNMNVGEIATFAELKTWAYYQGWTLDGDGSYGGIQNHICKMIPPQGYEFLFIHKSVEKSEVDLVLDITRFNPGSKEILRPQVLRIYVNGIEKKRLEVVGRKNFTNPVSIELDPGEFPDGRILVRLEPASPISLGKFWGLWDAHLNTDSR